MKGTNFKAYCLGCAHKFSIEDMVGSHEFFTVRCPRCGMIAEISGWSVILDGRWVGPFTSQRMEKLVAAGQLNEESVVCPPGDDTSRLLRDLSEVPEFQVWGMLVYSSERLWNIVLDGHQEGPFTTERVVKLVTAGQLDEQTPVKSVEPFSRSTALANVDELRAALGRPIGRGVQTVWSALPALAPLASPAARESQSVWDALANLAPLVASEPRSESEPASSTAETLDSFVADEASVPAPGGLVHDSCSSVFDEVGNRLWDFLDAQTALSPDPRENFRVYLANLIPYAAVGYTWVDWMLAATDEHGDLVKDLLDRRKWELRNLEDLIVDWAELSGPIEVRDFVYCRKTGAVREVVRDAGGPCQYRPCRHCFEEPELRPEPESDLNRVFFGLGKVLSRLNYWDECLSREVKALSDDELISLIAGLAVTTEDRGLQQQLLLVGHELLVGTDNSLKMLVHWGYLIAASDGSASQAQVLHDAFRVAKVGKVHRDERLSVLLSILCREGLLEAARAVWMEMSEGARPAQLKSQLSTDFTR